MNLLNLNTKLKIEVGDTFLRRTKVITYVN